MHSANPSAAGANAWLEIGDTGLFRLGGAVALDGRISWAPHLDGQFQPINCYLVREGDHHYLIDTGPPAMRQQIVGQLQSLVPAGIPITVSMTRAEFECSGNLGAVHTAIPIDEIIAGGMTNELDAYDELSRAVYKPTKRQKLAAMTNAINPLGQSARLSLIHARFRILTTYWLYDSRSRTMFTSDCFGHTAIAAPEAAPLIGIGDPDGTTVASATEHVLEKYSWLRLAQTGELIKWLRELFASFEVETIAPTHGCILHGKPVVERHLAILLEVLASVGRPEKLERIAP